MKRLIVLFTVMIFALLLVACGNNEETSQQSTSDSESNTDSNSNEESVHLTMSIAAGQNPERFRWEAEAFTEKYPHVTVEVVEYEEDWYNQNAVRLFNSSDRPDVAFFWLTGFYDSIVNSGALLPLDDLYESEGWYDVLPESTVEGAISPDGHKYGVAHSSIMTPLLMYNKKAFREAGIEGEPETIEELISLGPKLKEAGYIPWTSGLNNASQATQIFDIMTPRHVTPEFFQQLLSKEVMDYTHPDMIAAFTTIQKMADELMAPGAAGVEDLEARSLFAQERAAMYSDGSWNLAPLREEVSEDFELGIMTYPLAREGNQRTTGFYDKLGIVALKDTGNEEWAKKFIAHVLSYEQQSRLGEISANTPVRNDIDADTLSETYSEDIVNTYNRAMEEGTHSLFNPIMPGEYRHAATQLIQGLVMKELTPEEFAEEFTQMVEDIHNR